MSYDQPVDVCSAIWQPRYVQKHLEITSLFLRVKLGFVNPVVVGDDFNYVKVHFTDVVQRCFGASGIAQCQNLSFISFNSVLSDVTVNEHVCVSSVDVILSIPSSGVQSLRYSLSTTGKFMGTRINALEISESPILSSLI